MTRMWGVDPRLMCHHGDHEGLETSHSHLMGEHNEMHMIVGSIKKHPHGKAIAKGHAKKGQINTALIKERHDALAAEMERRGILHDSPLDYDDELGIGEVNAELDPGLDATSLKDELADRCKACRMRILGADSNAQ